jgi:hypothetical protein
MRRRSGGGGGHRHLAQAAMTLCSSGENKRAEGGVGIKGERNWERGGGPDVVRRVVG